MVRLAVALALLGGATLLPMRCATVSPTQTNTNAGSACRGSCASQPTGVDVEGKSLILTAVAARNQIIGKLRCDQLMGDSPLVGGQLVCPTANTNRAACCRLTEVTINPFTVTTEGTQACTGGGGNTFTLTGGKSCSSLEDGVTEVLKSAASGVDSYRCTGGNDCGYQVEGQGVIKILECPGKCEVFGGNITFTKTCQAVDVEGFWDEYKIQATVSMGQQCE